MKAAKILLVSLAVASLAFALPAVDKMVDGDDKQPYCVWTIRCLFAEGASCGKGSISRIASTAKEGLEIELKFIEDGFNFYPSDRFGPKDCPPKAFSKILCCDDPDNMDPERSRNKGGGDGSGQPGKGNGGK